MHQGSGSEICSIMGQNQARMNFFIKITFLGIDLFLSSARKFGPNPEDYWLYNQMLCGMGIFSEVKRKGFEFCPGYY